MMHTLCNHPTLSSWIENEAIRTAVYPTPALCPSNPSSPAEPNVERSRRTGVPLIQEGVISRRVSIDSIEKDSPASSSSASSTAIPLKLTEQPLTKFCDLWSPVDSG